MILSVGKDGISRIEPVDRHEVERIDDFLYRLSQKGIDLKEVTFKITRKNNALILKPMCL